MESFIVCITGASGSLYGIRTVQELSLRYKVFLVVSNGAYTVMEKELGISRDAFIKNLPENVEIYSEEQIDAPVASGSRFSSVKGVIVAPCSMGTLGAVANGISSNLIHRVVDVALKERKKVCLLVREMPYSLVHIENMRKFTLAGGIIAPASPGFYHRPESVDDIVNFVVGKLLDIFGVEHSLYRRWREDEDK
ncbi:MAG TPA: UbiX family flavin prenyltransferase [Persephonella sp.]|uniref:Flavin prenyltransferase UbiX n=1 Tax=Persephonella marina (strain DSM 14350 / EX-H1) TaxID=123214 RepID=C0QPQ4_PERMH|nr:MULTISPECIES: UbiX family flavin prenyltransferase [Persephonella]ACO03525.1 probable aromatic acid decarboxylase [Persephonella marina EX-H1]HCB69735.1 UbiX family flavin prenyltransferase [Persephonella sp.]